MKLETPEITEKWTKTKTTTTEHIAESKNQSSLCSKILLACAINCPASASPVFAACFSILSSCKMTSEWGEREANVGHLPVLCLSSRSSPVGGHLPAPTCVTVTTSSHCSGLVARFNLKIVFDSRADFRFCSKWNPFILGIFDLRDVRFSGFYCITINEVNLKRINYQLPLSVHER